MQGPKGPRRGRHLNELGIKSDGALLLRDGVIQEVGSTSRLEAIKESRGAIEINATGKVVMPGFVDCHTHLMFPPPQRGDRDIPVDIDGAARSVASITAQRLARRGRTYLETMARHGTTTLEAKSGCGPNESAELKVLRVLKVLSRDALDIVPTYLFRPGLPSYDSAALRDFMSKIRRRRLARFADLQWDTDATNRPLLHRFLANAADLGFPLKIHADQENPAEAVALAVEHAAVSIDHLEHATQEEARMLAGAQTIATLLPCASFRCGRYAPARTLIDAGVAIALGSNFNPQYSPSLNMQTAISLACLQMNMTPAEAISAATINASHALRLGADVGLFESGRQADVLILDTPDHRDLAYSLGTNLVSRTIKRGVIL